MSPGQKIVMDFLIMKVKIYLSKNAGLQVHLKYIEQVIIIKRINIFKLSVNKKIKNIYFYIFYIYY